MITLVHGTWGRGFFPEFRWRFRISKKPLWFERGSSFTDMLVAELRKAGIYFKLEPFLWSGGNSISERDRAASRLAKCLHAQALQQSGLFRVVIAHSHGGIVALRALCHLQGSSAPIWLITLGTPFLEVSAIPDYRFRVFRSAAKITMSVTVVLFLISLIANFWSPDGFLFGLLGSVAILFGGLLTTKRLFLPSQADKMSEPINNELIEAASYPPKARAAYEMLVLRAVDDEASLALSAGVIGAWLLRESLRLFSRVGEPVVYTAIASLVFGSLSFYLYHLLLPATLVAFKIAVGLFTISLFIPLAIIVLHRIGLLFMTLYGTEFFWNLGLPRWDVSVNSVPDHSGNLKIVTLPQRFEADKKFHHMLYENRECVGATVEWLRERLESWENIRSTRDDRI